MLARGGLDRAEKTTSLNQGVIIKSQSKSNSE
jgi:hypothetical protein